MRQRFRESPARPVHMYNFVYISAKGSDRHIAGPTTQSGLRMYRPCAQAYLLFKGS